MAKYSMKVKGKEIGPASTYAEPHTMSGKKVTPKVTQEPGPKLMEKLNMSVANIDRSEVKAPPGKVKTRGTGAATKGLYSSAKLG